MIRHPHSVYHLRHGRGLLPLLLLSVLLMVWRQTVEVSAITPNNDKMVANIFTTPFVCILAKSPTQFSVDVFLQSLQEVLSTLPEGKFNDVSQMELLEYCAWGNLTINSDSYCRKGGEGLDAVTNFSYTFVRYGVMIDDIRLLQKLNYKPLGAAVGPVMQYFDPAIFVPGETDLSFSAVVFSNETVITVVSVFLVCILVPLICAIFIWRHLRNVRQEKMHAEMLRRTLYESATSGNQEQEQQGGIGGISRNNRDGEVEAGREIERERREIRWGGVNVPISLTPTPSYWPSSTNTEEMQQQQQQQGREWYERELAPKPP
ncbi:hypothetical protein LSM04_007737 [Trypanosoma melophagium]|uniref:uncharacterized protein n=1 Tax=Trypanosoma melophagium TaxID=715481 RepID=UPI00351A5216|nr:hypothetical protein LSM04_007737 [Trypanosoma melophagium]